MCTVSFVCSEDAIIITSNRDEMVSRSKALEPKIYYINNKKIIFPKDTKANGTWFAVNENSSVLVLLNGAEEKHVSTGNYSKSRGLIVLDLISSEYPYKFWCEINLHNIEPFTLILFDDNRLYRLRWDGTEKENILLDINKEYIWSSSTLYSKEIKQVRKKIFKKFIEENKKLFPEKMIEFHKYTDDTNPENNIVIDRKGKLKTLSISQSIISKNEIEIVYHDLLDERNYRTTLKINNE